MSSGEDADEERDRIRRYDAKSDFVVFSVDSTSLLFRQLMLGSDLTILTIVLEGTDHLGKTSY